ncbi:uncharacterized protein LOC106752405 [Vigna radiata var. radiata]|uniref:DNA (cytosine-5-)-methyltransferase n=1 Tax=Vigna radiata var. radiata TaxID=3916 RepID=A0A1S3T731_VIGRR|nr:uncharacterized protein LOC106752405 [Vigna radiata var. radiata]
MGYKLAGFDHLGGVEIDPKIAKLYIKNHNPKYFYPEDVRDFNKRNDLPTELYDLDILDGSPPCTTFSMTGKREQTWGVKKLFREGQKKQTLDDLVLVYCDTIGKLRPKVAVLENVPGIIAGRAKKYAIEVHERLNSIGYDVQLFQLNSATMGVPQARERIFFIARRKDLKLPKLKFEFNEPPIPFGHIADKGCKLGNPKPLIPSLSDRWSYLTYADPSFRYADAKYRNKKEANSFFSSKLHYDDKVANTLVCSGDFVYYHEKRNLTDVEYRRMSSFPSDYDFCTANVRYVCGMSVPPLMIARVANSIREQCF